MKAVAIRADFDAYPDDRTPRSFAAGEVAELPDAFADLIIAKGLAAPADPNPAAAAAQTQETGA